MTEKPVEEATVEEAADAPAPEVWICVRDAEGRLPPLPVEQQAAFKEWIEEMFRQALHAPRRAAATQPHFGGGAANLGARETNGSEIEIG